MKIGVLGGTFNPPHIGHLVLAQEALERFGLERVLWIPAARPPHREVESDPGPEVRAELCELATADDERFEVSRIELEREGPSYTVDTIAALRQSNPQLEPFLILGGDQAASLPRWHEPERLLELAQVVVVDRTGWSRDAVAISIARLRGAERVRYFDMPRVEVSSTLVRLRIARGQSIRYLVPDAVRRKIEDANLYGAGRREVAAKS